MTIDAFLEKLKTTPEEIEFIDSIAIIDALYEFTASTFTNADLVNEAGQNSGSCKLFAFAQLQQLTESETLACFGHYYRDDVLQHPQGTDHQNIRNFMKSGWSGIQFNSRPLKERS